MFERRAQTDGTYYAQRNSKIALAVFGEIQGDTWGFPAAIFPGLDLDPMRSRGGMYLNSTRGRRLHMIQVPPCMMIFNKNAKLTIATQKDLLSKCIFLKHNKFPWILLHDLPKI